MNKVFVFANIGDTSKPPIGGGGQSSSRRVMKGFRDAGLEVVGLSRHYAHWEGKVAHIIEVLLFAVIDLVRIVFKLLKQNRKETIFYHMTFSGPLLPYEYIITKIVKCLGFKCVMYLQGGQFYYYYKIKGKRYRRLFAKVLDMQELVQFEGKEGIDLSSSITTTPLSYFPSYSFNKDIPTNVPVRSAETVRLLYFGRIDPHKHVEIVIDCFELLCEHRDDVYLTIIGGPGSSKEYVNQIDKKILSSSHSSHIERYNLSPYEFIKEKMQTHHFFVFPTSEPCEGHSNSLSEAMSQGLIPIVSKHNFNGSIVGNDLLVVDDLSAKAFADTIERILDEGKMESLSRQILERERELYSYDAVNPRIVKELKDL